MIHFNTKQLRILENGGIARANNGKRYANCNACGKFVCLDKVLFHSMHLCVSNNQFNKGKSQ